MNKIIFLSLLSMLFSHNVHSQSIYDSYSSNNNFFMDKLRFCKTCDTVTVIVSPSNSLNPSLISSFKVLSEDILGKHNGGSVVEKERLLEYIGVLSEYGCSSKITSGFHERFVLFIDVTKNICTTLPFNDSHQLIHIVHLITDTIKLNSKKPLDELEILIRTTVDSSLNEHTQIKALKPAVVELVNYLFISIREIVKG